MAMTLFMALFSPDPTLVPQVLGEAGVSDVIVPRVYERYTTRRLLVSEWIDGVKLAQCSNEEIRDLIAIGQECFLVQLLQERILHTRAPSHTFTRILNPLTCTVFRQDPHSHALLHIAGGLLPLRPAPRQFDTPSRPEPWPVGSD